MYSWNGRILIIDLTKMEIVKEDLDPKEAEMFLGGRGLNAKRLFDEIPPGADPLGPENILCLAPGLLTGTPLGLTGRLHVSTLSPYSGILGDGNVGGSFAHGIKKAGYDQVVIRGEAEKPVYLLIEDEKVELLDASELWGLDVWETTDRLIDKHGQNISVACIGQAGENLVRQASTMVDKYASAARGSGAVWGAKKIKAVAVKGSGKIKTADRKKYAALAGADNKYLREDRVQKEVASVYGSHYGMVNWRPGYRNFQKELEPEEVPEALRPEAWKEYETGRAGCKSCHIKCKNIYEIPSGRRKGEIGEALEYECIYCLGVNCGIEDPVAIMEMENLSDKYGVDVIAVGNTIALAKDLYNRGIIDENDTDGLGLDWEDAESQIELIHRTVMREGFGAVVAEGLFGLAKALGDKAMDYCYHVKGLSRGPHPPGLFALAHAVSTRGADHLRGRSWAAGDNSDEDILKKMVDESMLAGDEISDVIIGERAAAIADSIGRCKGAVNTWTCAVPLIWKNPIWQGLADLINAATGIEFDSEKIEKTADRINAIERAFNIRQGVKAEHDCLPQKPDKKFSEEGRKEQQDHFESVQAYYRVHGYDPITGVPVRQTMESLGLGYVSDALEKDGEYEKWDGPGLRPLNAYPQGGRRS